jgi:hypothetical protein
MGAPAAGEVVIVPFPSSDLTQSKVRPALCLAEAGRGDRLLCQITGQSRWRQFLKFAHPTPLTTQPIVLPTAAATRRQRAIVSPKACGVSD